MPKCALSRKKLFHLIVSVTMVMNISLGKWVQKHIDDVEDDDIVEVISHQILMHMLIVRIRCDQMRNGRESRGIRAACQLL